MKDIGWIYYRNMEVYAPDKILNIKIPEEKPKVFKIWKIFCLYRTKHLFWFRFFGKWGIHGKNIRENILLFSDRNNRRLVIKNWMFKFLK